jgi:anti-sigma-K factor RskA
MTHDDLHDSTGAYALGLLQGQERTAFEAHLAACAQCQAEVRAFAGVTRALDQAVEQHEPPAALRERVLARVPQSREQRPSALPADRGEPRPGSPALARWLAIAASIAAIAIALHAMTLRQRVRELERDLADERASTSALQRDLDAARARTLVTERMAFVLASSDVTRVDLAGQSPAPRAVGRAFWSPTQGLIFSADLPPAPPGRDYQLWVVTRGGPVSAGLLRSGLPRGLSLVTSTLVAPDPQALAVTLEPAGGVAAPTGPMYLVGKL